MFGPSRSRRLCKLEIYFKTVQNSTLCLMHGMHGCSGRRRNTLEGHMTVATVYSCDQSTKLYNCVFLRSVNIVFLLTFSCNWEWGFTPIREGEFMCLPSLLVFRKLFALIMNQYLGKVTKVYESRVGIFGQ